MNCIFSSRAKASNLNIQDTIMEDDVFTENGNKTNKVNLLKKKQTFQYTKARVLKVFSDLLAFIHSLIYNIYNVGEMLCSPPPPPPPPPPPHHSPPTPTLGPKFKRVYTIYIYKESSVNILYTWFEWEISNDMWRNCIFMITAQRDMLFSREPFQSQDLRNLQLWGIVCLPLPQVCHLRGICQNYAYLDNVF